MASGLNGKSVSIRAPERAPGRPQYERFGAGNRPVSIRAPERAPGRLPSNCKLSAVNTVSIRAPERAPGRPAWLRANLVRLTGFNPRPGASSGATSAFTGAARIIKFQSAPRSELRGDP